MAVPAVIATAATSTLSNPEFWTNLVGGLLDGGADRLQAAGQNLASATAGAQARSQLVQSAYQEELSAARRRQTASLLLALGLVAAAGVAVILIRRGVR